MKNVHMKIENSWNSRRITHRKSWAVVLVAILLWCATGVVTPVSEASFLWEGIKASQGK